MKVEKIKKADLDYHTILMDSFWGMIGYKKAQREKAWEEIIMKIEKMKKAFEPVVITLESQSECNWLESLVKTNLAQLQNLATHPEKYPYYHWGSLILEKLND